MSEPLFTIEDLRELCRGDVSKLPPFIVHDREGWKGRPLPDNKGRIHLNDYDFLTYVAPHYPVTNCGPFNATSILYTLDLTAEHLQGGADTKAIILKGEKYVYQTKRYFLGNE